MGEERKDEMQVMRRRIGIIGILMGVMQKMNDEQRNLAGDDGLGTGRRWRGKRRRE